MFKISFYQKNILIDVDGTAKWCDFGRSKIIGHSNYTTSPAGVARYLAPELHSSDDDDDTVPDVIIEVPEPKLTRQSDVYGFSMVALQVGC